MANKDSSASIQYEFETHPDIGQVMQVAPGIYWLRMFLPFSLSHINLWLLEGKAPANGTGGELVVEAFKFLAD